MKINPCKLLKINVQLLDIENKSGRRFFYAKNTLFLTDAK